MASTSTSFPSARPRGWGPPPTRRWPASPRPRHRSTVAPRAVCAAERVVVKVGGGARDCGPQLDRLLELVDAVAVTSPLVSGVLPYDHPRNMTVGGSKGSISGNYAMEHSDLLVALGSRSVCQSDCSRTGYPAVRHVINSNADVDAATHYRHTTALVGDAVATLDCLIAAIDDEIAEPSSARPEPSAWLAACQERKVAWDSYKAERYARPTLYDEVWRTEVLTQPAAIKIVTDLARARDAVCFFDAGDVQANGFQVVEDDRLGRTFTETGASYMGFAVSAVLASRLAPDPDHHFAAVALTGDGSFTMNPQVLIDGIAHRSRGTIVVFDNRRMGAISSLQRAQYGPGHDHATWDHVPVDYVAWAHSVAGVAGFWGGTTPGELTEAIGKALAHDGLSLVHVPVYFGDDPLGMLGAWGRWNIGSWVEETQALRHEIGL
jgi:3D-(3,5/4)-trihydroxycyclohexane-1,2-dione acylhydrolase (decyclizing)